MLVRIIEFRFIDSLLPHICRLLDSRPIFAAALIGLQSTKSISFVVAQFLLPVWGGSWGQKFLFLTFVVVVVDCRFEIEN